MTDLILKYLKTHYRIQGTHIVQLPLGADINASVYQVEASDQKIYFVKLKKGDRNKAHMAALKLLQNAGIEELIAPIETIDGEELLQVDGFTLIVYPFIAGHDGFRRPLTDQQWITLGRAMRQVHEVKVPSSLQTYIRREQFSSKWRDIVRSLPLLEEKRATIQKLVDSAEQLAAMVRHHPHEHVLCHSDIHGGNVLIDHTGKLFIVDWDDPILAPKERDLMFIGGGVGNVWNQPREEKLFYQGYGPVEIDETLLAYYRYERIVEDIAVYAQELLKSPTDAVYEQLMSLFEPNGVVDIAFKTKRIS